MVWCVLRHLVGCVVDRVLGARHTEDAQDLAIALLRHRLCRDWDDACGSGARWAARSRADRPSSGGQRGQDRRPAVLEAATSLGERDALARAGLGAAGLTLLRETGAAARGRSERAEPAQRVVALLQAPVIVRDPLVLVATATLGDAVAERLAAGARVRVVPVCGDLLGRGTGERACPRRARLW
jgi:hypothetical protein